MARTLAFLYGAVSYLIFFITFLYAIGFVGNIVVPKSIDTGPSAATFTRGLIANVILMSIFALQHSIMARPAFKRVWTRYVPKPVERSTYVLAASLALHPALLAMAGDARTGLERRERYRPIFLWALFLLGWGTVLLSTFLINHFELFGLKQVNAYRTGQEFHYTKFRTPFFYKFVRHPLYLGFIVAFWATPRMSVGHMLFAAVTTVYILVAIQLEERDLVDIHGEAYENYRRQVSMLLPIPKGGSPVKAKEAVPKG